MLAAMDARRHGGMEAWTHGCKMMIKLMTKKRRNVMQNCIQMAPKMNQNEAQMASNCFSNDIQNDTFWHHFGAFWCHFGCILDTKCAQIKRKTMQNGVPKSIKIT